MRPSAKQILINAYITLSRDNTDLSNKKALDIVHLSMSSLSHNEATIARLALYKHSFYLLAAVSFICITMLFTYLVQFYGMSLSKRYETNYYLSSRRVIQPVARRNRSHKNSYTSVKSKFLAGKIKILNPKANSIKLANQIIVYSADVGVDPVLVAAIIKFESRFEHKARSTVGAMGLMQVMPATASYMSPHPFNLYDSEHNLKIGISYIKYLSRLFKKDREKILMAYNWGPYNLIKSKAVPGKVRKYARDVLTTTNKWNKEFDFLTS